MYPNEHVQNDADLLQTIGARIRSARVERGLSLRDLAFSIGMEASNLSVIENGKSNPQILTYVKIAAALKIQLSDLFALGVNLDTFNESEGVYKPRKHIKD
jgi:transcriptional regulator with XRE-family HTH domain